MAWIYLILAGISEIVWAIGLKMSNGFTDLEWSLLTIAFMIFSFFMLAKALQDIPIGTAYAIFTGIGTAGAAIVGILWLNESANIIKVLSLVILLVGIIGLKFADGGSDKPVKESEAKE